MQLVRFRYDSEEKIGALLEDKVVDLAAVLAASGQDESLIPSSMRAFLAGGEASMTAAKEALTYAKGYRLGGYFRDLSKVTLLAPIGDPQKIICIGQNYRDHCEEQNQPLPERAIIFAKFPNTINDPGAPIILPKISEKVDYEAELALVIGKRCKHVSEEEAKDYIAGYMCLNDISARDIQQHPAEKQWVRGKTCDTFAPMGPVLTTADDIDNPHDLDISLTLNGELRQNSNTSNLIFGVYYLVSHLSKSVTLEPGDIITTGTPGGVGMYSNPQVFLKPGDTVSVTIEGIGTLTNPVVAE